ncbi:hypothetical protein HDV00_003386 [Rhizophlyctis rosea]|nr:hypothetical protein HDV00_003386 [Rhizophlyctis rosea]
MFIIAVLFLGTSATIVSVLLQRGLHDTTGNQLVQLALTTAATIDKELYERYSDLDILADLAMHSGTPDNTTSSNGTNSVFQTLNQRQLDKLANASDTFTWIGVADMSGIVRAAINGTLTGMNVSARPWWQTLATTDVPVYMGDVHSAVLLDKALNVTEPLRLMDIALPLYASNGTKIAIFGSHLNSKKMRQVESLILGTFCTSIFRAELFIIGSAGLVQAPVAVKNASMNTLPPISNPSSSIALAAQNQTGFTEEAWPDGHNYVTSYAKCGGYNGISLGWKILIRIPTSDAYRTMNSLLFTLGMAHIAFAIILLVVTYSIAHITTRPLVAIAIAADHIRKRSMIPRIPVVKGNDEIAILSSSLNSLVSTLVEKEINLKGINENLRGKVEALERAEMGLRSSEEKWRQLSENLEECFWIMERPTLDDPTSYAYMSSAYERTLGLPLSELLQDPYAWLTIVPPDDRATLQPLIATIHKKPIDATFRIRAGMLATIPHGERWICLRTFPVFDEGGKTCKRVIGVFQDVTRERSAEMESKHKTTWVRQVGHEIRNPLAATWTMVNLLLELDVTPEQRDLLETIKTSNDTLLSLINSILDLSKLEAGEMHLESIPFSLRTQIEDVLDLMAPQANKKGLRVGGCVEDDVVTVIKGDPLRLRQIIINLFTNSVKFTKTGSVFLTVKREESLEREPKLDGGKGSREGKVGLRFEVKDTGIGIAKENIPKLFKEFAQAESNTSRMYGGTGLGLSIVRRLVNLMNGDVGITSVLGEGSCFSFTAQFGIPTLDDIQRPSLEDLQYMAMGGGMGTELKGCKVLILTEWEGMRKVLERAVKEGGGDVIIRSDIEKGVLEFTPPTTNFPPPDAVVIDLWSPNHTHLITPATTIGSPLFLVAPRERRDSLRTHFAPDKVYFVPDPVKPRRFVEDLGKVFGAKQMGGGAGEGAVTGITIGRTVLRRGKTKVEEPLNKDAGLGGKETLRVMLVEGKSLFAEIARAAFFF